MSPWCRARPSALARPFASPTRSRPTIWRGPAVAHPALLRKLAVAHPQSGVECRFGGGVRYWASSPVCLAFVGWWALRPPLARPGLRRSALACHGGGGGQGGGRAIRGGNHVVQIFGRRCRSRAAASRRSIRVARSRRGSNRACSIATFPAAWAGSSDRRSRCNACSCPTSRVRANSYTGSSRNSVSMSVRTTGGRMVWGSVCRNQCRTRRTGRRLYRRDREATIALGLGANVLAGGSDRTVALQPLSTTEQSGLNLAVGVASLQLRAGADA